MVDLQQITSAKKLNFYSDASANNNLGFGAVFDNCWLYARWEDGYIEKNKPSIEYLELFALSVAIITWGDKIKNQRIAVFCDNIAVVHMINNGTSSCKNCMYLLRLVTLDNMINNRGVFAIYVKSADNFLADALSRLQFNRFSRLVPKSMNKYPHEISPIVWPASCIWMAD